MQIVQLLLRVGPPLVYAGNEYGEGNDDLLDPPPLGPPTSSTEGSDRVE